MFLVLTGRVQYVFSLIIRKKKKKKKEKIHFSVKPNNFHYALKETNGYTSLRPDVYLKRTRKGRACVQSDTQRESMHAIRQTATPRFLPRQPRGLLRQLNVCCEANNSLAHTSSAETLSYVPRSLFCIVTVFLLKYLRDVQSMLPRQA